MTTHTELYRFVEVGSVDPFTTDQNLCFILDKSGSMNEQVSPGVTRFAIAKEQLKKVLDEIDLKRIERGISVHLHLIAFSGESTLSETRRDADTTAVAELKTWIDGLTANGGTPYNTPLQNARAYFLTPTPADFRQSCFFITDGLPDPVNTAQNAADTCADMITRTGPFAPSTGNEVDIYCMSVDLFDTTYLGLLDNTPRDAIPVLSSTNSDALYNAVMNAIPSDLNVWTYTSGDEPIVHLEETYTPIPIGRSEVESKNELSRANIDVKLSLDNEMGKRWLHDNVEIPVGLTVYERDADGDIGVVWKGRLAGVRPNMSEIVLNFESIFTSLRRPGLRARFLRTCRHMLYGRGCGVDKELFAAAGVVTAMAGKVVTIPEAALQPNGYYTTGMLEGPDGTLRFITNHVGDQITLFRPFESLAKAIAQGEDTSCRLFPGCSRNRDVCNSRFNNIDNYGGFDWIPLRNPFDGSSIV